MNIAHRHRTGVSGASFTVHPLLYFLTCMTTLFCLVTFIFWPDEVHNSSIYQPSKTVYQPNPSSSETIVQDHQMGDWDVWKHGKHVFAHDHPDHPWHWTREHPPNPTMGSKRDCKGTLYEDMYQQFHEEGFIIFESCSLKKKKDSVLDAARTITANLPLGGGADPRATQILDRPVREISTDPDSLEFIEYLHGGRRVFPFQTLNFRVPTQQMLHSDLIHFDTQPRTLLTAAWVALEDVTPQNGGLQYVPGSHRWGTWDFEEIGLRDKTSQSVMDVDIFGRFYGDELERLVKLAGLEIKIADKMTYGQSIIWAANLVHGGSKVTSGNPTRYSQVTHYWFEGADYYWEPRKSNVTLGQIHYRPDVPVCTAHKTRGYAPSQVHSCADKVLERWHYNSKD